MADIPVKIYRSSTVRPGTSPSNPGFPADETPVIENPPGNGGVPIPFTGLTDTPPDYVGHGSKVVSVKADESGLEFTSGLTGSGTANEIAYFTASKALASLPVSTYPSIAELAHVKGVTSAIQTQINGKQATIAGTLTNGHVATIVAGVPTWAAPAGGSSNWTVVGSDIYRNSSVSIGLTTIPTNATFTVRSLTATGTNKFLLFQNDVGTELAALTQGGSFNIVNNIGVNNAAVTNVAGVFKAFSDTTATAAFRTLNLTGTTLFEITGSTVRANTGMACGNFSPNASIALECRPIGFNIAIRISSTTPTAQMDIMGNNGNIQSLGGAFFGSANTGTAPTGRVNIRGAGTTTANTLLLEDSAGTDNAVFLDNGQIRFLRLPTSSAGLASGSLWNNSGVLNIV